MKLLLDQNISFRVGRGIRDRYPEARQVRELGIENATDRMIWNYAKENGYTIVTFDADYYDLVALYGHPPKIIWLRLGNTATQKLIKTLELHYSVIKKFVFDEKYKDVGCLEIKKHIP